MAKINLSGLYRGMAPSFGQLLTIRGIEYEFTWIDPIVEPTTFSYLRIITPPNKFTVVNFREVQTDQERGFYRFFTDFVDDGTPIGDPTPLIKMRGDSPIASGAVAQRVTPPSSINRLPPSRVVEILMTGSPGQGNRPAAGAFASGEDIRIIPPGSKALLEFENQSVENAYMRGHFKQWEILPSAMPDVGEI